MADQSRRDTRAATGRTARRAPESSSPDLPPIRWTTVVTACLVSVGLVLGAVAGVSALGQDRVGAEEFAGIQQLTNEQLDAMGDDELSGLLEDLDAAAEAHVAPASVIEMEQLRVQGIWEEKWYANEQEVLPAP